MKKDNRTIIAPAKTVRKWVETLRSGKYKQGFGALQENVKLDDEKLEARYCCLGVLQHCLTGRISTQHGEICELPPRRWLNKYGIKFHDSYGDAGDEPFFPSLRVSASEANDTYKYSFKKIATAIEKAAGLKPLKNRKKKK